LFMMFMIFTMLMDVDMDMDKLSNKKADTLIMVNPVLLVTDYGLTRTTQLCLYQATQQI
jgi:hypothetical protein